MKMREYYELFRYLMEQRCLLPENIVFVDDIAQWSRERGIPETDKERPLKLVMEDGPACKMLIREDVSEAVIDERIRAMDVRDQLENVARDRAGSLNSIHKKLAYLFLREYAVSLPEVGMDDILGDNWAFGEMERLGYFRT